MVEPNGIKRDQTVPNGTKWDQTGSNEAKKGQLIPKAAKLIQTFSVIQSGVLQILEKS